MVGRDGDLLDRVRRDGREFFSSTRLDGRFTRHMAALVHRTQLEPIGLALETLRKQAAAQP